MVERRLVDIGELNRRVQAQRRQREAARQAAAAQTLDDYDVPMRGNSRGRPRIVLAPWFAQRLLADPNDRCGLRWAAGKYGLSREWIKWARVDGRLEQMARGEYGTPNFP